MKKSLQFFFEKHNFWHYKNYQDYQKNLDLQIHESLSRKNINHIQFRQKWSERTFPKKTTSFITMDLGGTYLRICLCQIQPSGQIKIIDKFKTGFYNRRIYTPEILLGDLKNHLDHFLKPHTTLPQTLVFSFANAIHQHFRSEQILDGKILYWGKNHREQGLIGLELGLELEKFLELNNYPKMSVCVINDSSLALLATDRYAAEEDSPVINLVVGSGNNISTGYNTASGFKLINLEFGNLDFIPYSDFDDLVNHHSQIPNKFRTEKLIAGTWQHLLFRVILNKAVIEKIIPYQKEFTQFENMTASDLEAFFQKESDLSCYSDLKDIWTAISRRGAFICALGVNSIIQYLEANHLLKKQIFVSETGAVLEHSHEFRRTFEKELQTMLKQKISTRNIKLELIMESDPVNPGAAVLLSLCGK